MADLSAWGIDRRYKDGRDEWHDVPEETVTALLAAMDADGDSVPDEPALKIIPEGTGAAVDGPSTLRLEDATEQRVNVQLPSDLPLGYHQLTNLESGRELRLIVTPRTCYLPADLRIWGWALQLYSLMSRSSWGIGDLADLQRFVLWSADKLGAGLVMTNPLGAATPDLPQQPSPYYPSSRLYRNLLYLAIEQVPGAREAIPQLDELAVQGRRLNDESMIQRDSIYKLKLRALEAIWSCSRDRVNFSEYEIREGKHLELFAAFCVLAEMHGSNWRNWPGAYQRPNATALGRLKTEHSDRMRFFKWIQWLLDSQLARASERRTIMQDLPIGVDPDGADAWMWQDVFARGVSVGAPPDTFNSAGQDWGLPPFIPHKLRADGYEPFIQTMRSTMRYSAALRMDHVMGLFRLFCIPVGKSGKEGTYVRYNSQELLSILALESVRAQAFVVGEDLGTVEEGVREKLAERKILSYRLLWFEDDPPEKYPELAVAAVTTHDLPTIAGAWTGTDIAEERKLGMKPQTELDEQICKQLRTFAKVKESDPLPTVIKKAHKALARAPSAVVLAELEDVLGMTARPNLPGTSQEVRPNWSIPLPKKLEKIEIDSVVLDIAKTLGSGRRRDVKNKCRVERGLRQKL